MEYWKAIPGYGDKYEVSNLGAVRNKNTNQIKTQNTDKYGYARVNLKTGRKAEHKFIHRLVAGAFIDNPNNKPQVNHIDGNKLNNSIDNLEWVTCSENMIHAVENGLVIYKPVIGINKITKERTSFYSARSAAIKTRESLTGIYACLNGKQHSTLNYYWIFAN